MKSYKVRDSITNETTVYGDIFEMEEALRREYDEFFGDYIGELCHKLRANDYTGDLEALMAIEVEAL